MGWGMESKMVPVTLPASCRVTAPADAPTYVWHVSRAVQMT